MTGAGVVTGLQTEMVIGVQTGLMNDVMTDVMTDVVTGVVTGVMTGVEDIPAFIASTIRLYLLGVPIRPLRVCLFDGDRPISAFVAPCRPHIIQTSVSFYKFKEGHNRSRLLSVTPLKKKTNKMK